MKLPRISRAGLRRVAKLAAVLPVPTRLGLYFLGAWLLMYLAGSYYEENAFVLLSCVPLALLVLNGCLVWWNLRRLEFARALPVECHAGEPVEFTLKLVNRGRLTRFAIELEDELLPGMNRDQRGCLLPSVSGGHVGSVSYLGTFGRRGNHLLKRCIVSTAFPFGLMRMTRRMSFRSEVTVYPRPSRLSPEFERQLLEVARYFGESAASARGQDEVFGVREYLPGHNVAHIHWKTTARTGKPMVLELEGRQDASFVLMLDTYPAGQEPAARSRHEVAISFMAGIIYYLTTQKVLFRFACFGDALHSSRAERGDRHYHAIMRHLAFAGLSDRRLSEWLPQVESIGRNEVPVLVTLGTKEHAEAALGPAPGAIIIGAADADFRRHLRVDQFGRRSVSSPELAGAGLGATADAGETDDA